MNNKPDPRGPQEIAALQRAKESVERAKAEQFHRSRVREWERACRAARAGNKPADAVEPLPANVLRFGGAQSR